MKNQIASHAQKGGNGRKSTLSHFVSRKQKLRASNDEPPCRSFIKASHFACYVGAVYCLFPYTFMCKRLIKKERGKICGGLKILAE